ncbi:hypothetical protein SUGI_0238840 [Cryptomeria japonica]|uniref:cyclin-dependent kinase G-2 n=1 Tax=Cryptomeria japonica TaxID=3369 RepID=UPI002408A472|nr:cyclin-dependent kinase G-2 [Cryptomeria japonica]GLJ14737.1 hypothetical protein SUGI_0238840 [Cryptomeria japonica]
MASVRVHHASSRSRSVFSCVDGDSNPARSEAYFSHHRNHQTLSRVETLKTLAKVQGNEVSRVKGCEDRDNYGSRSYSRSNSWSSGSEREPGEISSVDRGEELIDFHEEVKKPHDFNKRREYSWDAEIEVSKRKHSCNNVKGVEQRAPMLMDDECEPGQIQESPEETKSLQNISASRWADTDDDFQSPNPKRKKLSSSPGKKAFSSPSPKLISDNSVKISSDFSVKVSSDSSSKISSNSSAKFSANNIENSFSSPRIKPLSIPSANLSYDTSVRNFFDAGARIFSSVNQSLNAMEGESLVAKSPELYTEEMPLVNIAASRWADDGYFDSPDLKRSRVSPDFGYCEREQQKSKNSANNSAGETLSPENQDLARQKSAGSGVSSVCSDSDGSRHSCETSWKGELGVSDDEHDLKIVDTDDRHDLKVGVSDEEKDQMDVDGDDDQACLDPNEVLPSDSDSPVLSPLAVAVRRIDMMQGCRSVFEFERLNKINEGTYGIVYRARNKKTGEIVALKKVKMERERDGFPMSALREINVLLSLHHPSVVNVKEVVVGDNVDDIYMVMEYMEHDLKDFIGMMKQPFSTSEVKCLMLQLLQGVNYLHDNWVLHRDLKTSNLLINNKGELKVCDFGLARQYGSPLKTYTDLVVTLWYRAPELLLGAKKYSTDIDMWSVGCIMAELLAKEPLFSGKSEIDQLDKIFRTLGTPTQKIWPDFVNLPGAKCRFVKQPYNRLREKFPAASFTGKTTLSESGFDLLNRLLTYDPNKRITAEEALNHDWFKEVPLAKSKEFMPTYPTRSDHDRQSRRMRKSPDPLAQLKKESQQESVSDESSRLCISRPVLALEGLS